MHRTRVPNVFERVLLIVGVVVILVGYGLIQKLLNIDGGLSWNFLIAVFLWLILIAVVILAAVNENVKEELKIVIENQLEEIKLLRKEVRELHGKFKK